MDNYAQSVCNLWHRSKLIIGALLGIGVSWIWKYFNWIFSYQDIDLIIKLFTGIAPFIAAYAAFWTWNKNREKEIADRKIEREKEYQDRERELYERRLNKVYGPLMWFIIQQKEFQEHVFNKDIRDRLKCGFIFSVEINGGISTENYSMEIPDSSRDIFCVFNKECYGLVKPELLALLSRYYLVKNLYDDEFKKIKIKFPDYWRNVDIGRRIYLSSQPEIIKVNALEKKKAAYEIELMLKIIDGYNECIIKIGMDNQKMAFNSEDFWEKTS